MVMESTGAAYLEVCGLRKSYGEDEARVEVLKRIDVALVQEGAVIDSVEDWGKRKLAFEVDHLTEGDYTLINFHADPTQIAELDRVLRINDAVKRHMIVRRSDRD